MPANSTTARPPRLPRRLVWGGLFLVYTAIAFLLVEYRYLDDLSRQRPGTFLMRLLEEGTGVYSFFLLLPVLFRFALVYLFEGKGWLRVVLLHLAAATFLSAAHLL
jgi:hypothetical protein